MTILESPVSVAEFEALVDAMPAGLTAELINGRVIVTPAPEGDHSENIKAVTKQVFAANPELWLYAEVGLTIGPCRDGRARADGAVARTATFAVSPHGRIQPASCLCSR